MSPVHVAGSAPDWVMLGWHPGGQDGVILFASNTLTFGELEIARDYYQGALLADPHVYLLPPPRITMRAEMTDVVMIEAATYAEALAKLAERWQPAEPQPAALPRPQREIRS